MNDNKKKNIYIISSIPFIIGLFVILLGIYIDNNTNKEGFYTIRIDKNGATSVEDSKLECEIGKNDKCTVILPEATRKNGEVLGYSYNKDAKSADYKIGEVIELDSNKTIYVISYKKVTMTVVTDQIDYISNADSSCNLYNKDSFCSVVPAVFNKEGYEVRGYSTSQKSQAGYIYPNTIVELDEDITVYPIWNTFTRGKEINVKESFTQGSMTFDVEDGCPRVIYGDFLEYFRKIEKLAPYLVIGTKISFLTDKTFDEIWGTGYVGMNYGPTDLRMIDVRCSMGNNYYATIVHEMAHTWDFHYKSEMGSEISKQNDVINIFNKYRQMNNRPFRDYSYSDIREFFADMVRYYYLKFTDPIPEYELRAYPNDIKKNLEKYICITNNGYKEDKCQ